MIKNQNIEKWKFILGSKETKIPVIKLKDFKWIYELLGWDKGGKQQSRYS